MKTPGAALALLFVLTLVHTWPLSLSPAAQSLNGNALDHRTDPSFVASDASGRRLYRVVR